MLANGSLGSDLHSQINFRFHIVARFWGATKPTSNKPSLSFEFASQCSTLGKFLEPSSNAGEARKRSRASNKSGVFILSTTKLDTNKYSSQHNVLGLCEHKTYRRSYHRRNRTKSSLLAWQTLLTAGKQPNLLPSQTHHTATSLSTPCCQQESQPTKKPTNTTRCNALLTPNLNVLAWFDHFKRHYMSLNNIFAPSNVYIYKKE